jgi:hypothetical protein
MSKAKAKDEEEPKEKRKASEVDSEESESKEPLVKKVKSQSVIEDSDEEWEGIQDEVEVPGEEGLYGCQPMVDHEGLNDESQWDSVNEAKMDVSEV